MLAEGLTNKLIAYRLGISEHTVKFHVTSIMGEASRRQPHGCRDAGDPSRVRDDLIRGRIFESVQYVQQCRYMAATPGYGHEGSSQLGSAVQLRDIKKNLPLRVLSPKDWDHWVTWGYVVLPEVVPPENIDRLKSLLWEFQELNPSDPSTWNKPQLRDNRMTELNNTGMVEIYNHQYLWDNRQHPRIYDAFVDIWDRKDLWVTIDRANLNTPNLTGRKFASFIHWDSDTTLTPLPINVQGVLALTSTDPEVGGFQCVPELFRNFEQWIAKQPQGATRSIRISRISR